MATPPALPIGSGHVGATPPPQLLSLSDDLLLEIFLRIRCPADLTRTSAACVAFRHLIADTTFIRRYRSHHPPLLLGFLKSDASKGFHPVEAPHPNAPAARAVSNISFDYLPPAKGYLGWYTSDVRDGRVLFQCSGVCNVLLDIIFAVCDPLSRRFRVLPTLPNYREGKYLQDFDAVLAPCAENKEETSFSVIFMVHYDTEVLVAIFDSDCFSWTLNACAWSWNALSLSNETLLWFPYEAYGCFYWKVDESKKLLKLDVGRMELSTVVLPPRHGTRKVAVVEVGEGILGMFSYNQHRKVLSYYHYNSQIAGKWQKKKVIPLPVHEKLWISEARQGYMFIQVNLEPHDFVGGKTCYHYYSIDIKTLKLESVCGDLPYFGFPPSLSPRLI